MTQNCSRCNGEYSHPIEQSLNYVRSSEFSEVEPVEVTYGMLHTEETLAKLDEIDEKLPERDRQALSAEAARPGAPVKIEVTGDTVEVENDGGTVTTVEVEQIDFSIPVDEFDHIEIEGPNEVQENDDLAISYTTTEEREVPKTGLVCSDCLSSEDSIIWGPDN